MGRKRKAGSLPSPRVPSFPAIVNPRIYSPAGARPPKKSDVPSRRSGNRPRHERPSTSGDTRGRRPDRPTPTAPTGSSLPRDSSARSSRAVQPLSGASKAPSSPPSSPQRSAPEHFTAVGARAAALVERPAAGQPPEAQPGTTPGEVIGHLLHECEWQLDSCWGQGCGCVRFKPSTTTPNMCSCGHRSCAHELVDARETDREQQGRQQQQYRGYRGDGVGAATAHEVGVRLRRLFSAVRNARAVGDCGLFEDSEGLGGWGAGWFLSRLSRRYINQARQTMTELGGALHDPPAVARCLSAAEALLSGDTGGRWVMPDSLPSSSIYQALGTGIASELDLAYWHARYTAASRFDAGGVTADTESSSHQVVPPPEVYFVGLAFHVPTIAEVRASAALDNNPALLRVLVDVFDLPVGDGGAQRHANRGLSPRNSGGGGEIRFPVLENPLLTVAQSAWLETAVSASAKSWVPHFPPRFGDNEGTMRGSDPGLPPPIRLRCDATRDWSARLLAFAVPNRRALDACKRALDACGVGGAGRQEGGSGGIVEVGAGLGYWKWVLEGLGPSPGGRGGGGGGDGGGTSRGVSLHLGKGGRTLSGGDAREASPLKFLAIDKDPSRVPGRTGASATSAAAVGGGIDRERERGRGTSNGGRRGGKKRARREGGRGGRHGEGQSERPTHNEYHGGAPAWAVVEQGGPEQLRALSAAAYPVLLLCYPPPSVGVGAGASGCMGADALARFSGKVLLYIGEVGGDTGSPSFEAALRAGWDLVEEVDLPCFSSTANRLMVFARKGAFSSGGGVFASPAGSGMKRKDAVAAAARLDTPGEDACPTGDAAGGGGGAGMAMYRCSGCGVKAAAAAEGGVRLHRCRLTRSVSFCSDKCLTLGAERWRADLDSRHVHLAPGTAVEVAKQSGKYGGVFRDKKLFKRLA